MSQIKELYKEFNLDLISQEENTNNINHNYSSSKKLNSLLNLGEENKDEKDSIISDLEEDDEPFLATNEIKSKNIFHNPINLNLNLNKENNNNLPKYNRKNEFKRRIKYG